MNHHCCVHMCSSWVKLNKELSFHTFPKKGQRVLVETKLGKRVAVDRREEWIRKLKIGKPVSPYMRVCSLHFSENDYFYRGDSSKLRRLKFNAVPSRKLPLEDENQPGPSSSRSLRLENRQHNKTKTLLQEEAENPIIVAEEKCTSHNEEDAGLEHTEEEMQAAEQLISLLHSQPNYCGPKSLKDFGVQVNTSEVLTLSHFIKTESALNSFTGMNNFKLLNCLVHQLEKEHLEKKMHRLSLKDRTILVMTKLKTNLSYATLAVLFGISPPLCRYYILELIPVLSKILSAAIYFPDRKEIKNNMPKCFKEFSNVRIVLDCTEIYIQKPKCLCCRIKFYSYYKSNLTVKFMTGVSPGGLITFVSESYGGKASDKCIFESSNLISMLTPKEDTIMVDKGFLIDDICNVNQIELIRPPFLRQQRQLSATEAIFNAKIASARVHIERSNQRIKIFDIPSGKLKWSLVPYVKDIFTIICGITNLSSSILADQRFLTE